ncbi:MAG: hypothetical protein LBV43_06950 [Prevotella sp.]|nr:hypothetical protein [Prevotella sp.]
MTWQIASCLLPGNCQDMDIQRVLIRHGFSHNMAQLVIDDLKRCINYFQKHPIVNNSTKQESQGFHH